MPGNLVPDDLREMQSYLNVGLRELFEKYLVVKIFWADKSRLPSFGFSPVTVDKDNHRQQSKVITPSYLSACKTGEFACVFLRSSREDPSKLICGIHCVKPYGCMALKCSRMTNGENIRKTNAYYGELWREDRGAFDILFPKLNKTMDKFEKKNKVITEENLTMFFAKKISPIFLNQKFQHLSFFAK